MLLFSARNFAALIIGLAGSHCLQWSPDLPDGAVKYACAGDVLQLPWDFMTSGDVVLSVQWFFQGLSQEMMAFESHGTFVPTPSFSNRLQRVGNAGLLLSHVTKGDRGSYSVEVSGHDSNGISFTARRTVMAYVMENNNLSTTDGGLHAMLEPQAIYSNTTGQWSLVVSCGNFTFPGDPPFNVEWMTPSGAVIANDGYKDGYFQLHVTSGGDYTCRIPQHAAADASLCNITSQNATVHVDKMEARMTLMEAEVKQLRQRETDLTDYVHSLESRLDTKDTSLTQSVQQGQQREANLTDYIHSLETRLDNKDSNLSQSLQYLSNRTSMQVGFTVSLSRAHYAERTTRVIFNHIIANYGNGYSSSTAQFTAPLAGLYFFLVTASPHSINDNPNAAIVNFDEGATLCETNVAETGSVASCGAAVHLSAGQKVGVSSQRFLAAHYTFFTGFLISAD